MQGFQTNRFHCMSFVIYVDNWSESLKSFSILFVLNLHGFKKSCIMYLFANFLCYFYSLNCSCESTTFRNYSLFLWYNKVRCACGINLGHKFCYCYYYLNCVRENYWQVRIILLLRIKLCTMFTNLVKQFTSLIAFFQIKVLTTVIICNKIIRISQQDK